MTCVSSILHVACKWFLQDNSEQSLFVKTPQVWLKWFGLANDRLASRKGLGEGSETPIGVNIIDNNRSPRSQSRPSQIYLKTNIVFTMQAVMNEKIDLTKLGKYIGKATSARPSNIRPASRVSAANRQTDLAVPHMLQRRMVNAPQMARAVSFERFKDKPRRNTMSDTSLDNIEWA